METEPQIEGRTVAPAASRRPFTTETQVQSQICSCEIYGGP